MILICDNVFYSLLIQRLENDSSIVDTDRDLLYQITLLAVCTICLRPLDCLLLTTGVIHPCLLVKKAVRSYEGYRWASHFI